jgi:hypothetical protein
MVHQPILARFARWEDSPRQGQFGGAPLTQRRHHHAEDNERPQPDPDFGQPECRVVGRHHDVAIRRQSGAAGQRRSVHRRDQRLSHADPG